MRRQRCAKILATLGPASDRVEVIESLFKAGADAFRLNFSHGKRADHKRRLEQIRSIEARYARPIGVLLDLQGPKLRVGTFEGGAVDLEPGQRFRLDLDKRPGDSTRATLPHPEIFRSVEPGQDLLLDDGRIRLHVQKVSEDYADTEVVLGGRLSERKGVNVPGAVLPISALTAKDREDLSYGIELGVDWVALSFVQRPDDLAEARRLIRGRAALMAKIEKPSATEQLQEIIDYADGIMVARGDLGVELPPERVPGIQKRAVRACRMAGKPVVVATQMLESMISAPTPTRAEASDVATAVYDGADAVMLSAETAVGQYPTEAVDMMDRVIRATERDPNYRPILDALHPPPEPTAADAISSAAAQVAATIGASAIISYTSSGSTALRAARQRPVVPIVALTSRPETARRLALLWGAHCVTTADVSSAGEMVQKACRMAADEEFAPKGGKIVVTAGVPFGTPGSTNLLRIAWIE